MFIRVIITKFPNDNKKQLALAFISTVAPRFQNDSKLIEIISKLHFLPLKYRKTTCSTCFNFELVFESNFFNFFLTFP